jgi:hypothetical protein
MKYTAAVLTDILDFRVVTPALAIVLNGAKGRERLVSGCGGGLEPPTFSL